MLETSFSVGPQHQEVTIKVPATAEELSRIRDWVRTHFGISFAADQGRIFEQRMRDFLAGHRITASELLGRMQSGADRSLTLRFAEAMSTNYTYFFREPESFDFLAKSVLPAVRGQLRVWCAAASSGDEPYSIAMTAREVLGDAASSSVKILGTDLSERQLRIAEQGLYPAHQLAQLGATRLQRWMSAVGLGQFAVVPEVRNMCTFRRLNLTSDTWPFEQKFHLIFLRNVLYYFDPPLRVQILERCYDVTEPGGYLITSLTEPLLDLKTRWKAKGSAIYWKPT